jgi:hypothetical protein
LIEPRTAITVLTVYLEHLERRELRDFARQRGQLVVGEQQVLHVFQVEQRGRQLRQTHAHQLHAKFGRFTSVVHELT